MPVKKGARSAVKKILLLMGLAVGDVSVQTGQVSESAHTRVTLLSTQRLEVQPRARWVA
jgi:hypothetical protein